MIAKNGTQHQEPFIEEGSGRFISDLIFRKGIIGANVRTPLVTLAQAAPFPPAIPAPPPRHPVSLHPTPTPHSVAPRRPSSHPPESPPSLPCMSPPSQRASTSRTPGFGSRISISIAYSKTSPPWPGVVYSTEALRAESGCTGQASNITRFTSINLKGRRRC